MSDVDDNRPKLKKLSDGMGSFFELFKLGEWADILVRIALFIFLVVITHTVVVWIMYRLVLPFLQMWFVDQIFDQMTRRVEKMEWSGFQLTDIVRR